MASETPEYSNQKCSTPDCNKKLTLRGFCVACYYRNLRHGVIKKGEPTKKFKHRLTNIDEINRTADCLLCGKVKIFAREKKGQWRCSVASNEKSKIYKEAYRQNRKLMLKDYCEICFKKENLCYDHSHVTNKFRGTLCQTCNSALGMFKDDITILKNAIKYLKLTN